MTRRRSLTVEQQAEIRKAVELRQELSRTLSNKALARRFGVHWRTIVNAVKRTYKTELLPTGDFQNDQGIE